jgi:predicted tellurium resistance membrane protein TerC
MTEFFDIFLTWQGWLYLFILTMLEIVLGIDNIIFISIVTDNLPKIKKRKARNIGLSLALIIRLILLCGAAWIMKLTYPLFTIFNKDISWQSIVLIVGGIFLIYKSTIEMHKSVKGVEEGQQKTKSSLKAIILQIVVIDIIFSFDSIISAVGMTNGIEAETHSNPLAIIFISVIFSMIIMLIFSGAISSFISENPTIKMIALSFLVTVGILLIAEAFDSKIPKGYVYFGLVFSLIVELMNIKMRKNSALK